MTTADASVSRDAPPGAPDARPTKSPTSEELAATMRAACKKIAPVWPLESFVAVNPYLGMIDRDFATVAEELGRVAQAKSTMPLSFYVEAFDRGQIRRDDLDAALRTTSLLDGVDTDVLLAEARGDGSATAGHASPAVATVADVAAEVTGRAWDQLLVDRVSSFAAAHFDKGQAIWGAPPARSLYGAWRAEALVDRTPEVMGLRGFRKAVATIPDTPLAAARVALDRLDVPADGLGVYLHRLLLRVGGWSAYAARIVWDAGLYHGAEDDTLLELLAVLLSWEAALLACLGDRGVRTAWISTRAALPRAAQGSGVGRTLAIALVLQDAFERSTQRTLLERLMPPELTREPEKTGAERTAAAGAGDEARPERPRAQAIFCIDVRSEVFRRHLEATDGTIETLGFAGFFAFPVSYVPLASEASGAQCPVLLTPAHEVVETLPDTAETNRAIAVRRLRREVQRAWTSFKMGAISCFSFVGPVGLAYLPKLFSDGFGWTRPVPLPADAGLPGDAAARRGPTLTPGTRGDHPTGIPLDARIDLAAGALGAMSLTDGFARLVLITGHGSTTANNPHATGLDCGACGGRTGEANARVAAATLNDSEVRAALTERGIHIPDDTVFLACQHDTTTDQVKVFDRTRIPASHQGDLEAVEAALSEAGRRTRAERSARLHLRPSAAIDPEVLARSRDWAQVRPEWGLAGCAAFVVAPRTRTLDTDFGGRSFLHSYAWRQDEGFAVLELIMTAPMVVASWISLQYYASTVDNRLWGCGNKTLHNVVGTVGVVEGNAGDLRVGLPWQSIHDGEGLQHDPVRLNVVIEAPTEAMNEIIAKHQMVRHLLDNGWLHLFAMDDDGRIAKKYVGGLSWVPVNTYLGGGAPAMSNGNSVAAKESRKTAAA